MTVIEEKQQTRYDLVRVTCFFWAVAKLITWKLWLADRWFPLVPPFKILVAPAFVHLLLFCASLSCLAFLLFKPRLKLLLYGLLVAELLPCLLDQNRWQPWQYQYLFIILILLMYAKSRTTILAAVGFVLCCTYFYSGSSKLNNTFIERVWTDVILIRFLHVNEAATNVALLKTAGYLLPVIEMVCGVGLFFKATKRKAALVLIAMHLFNLLLLGPFGINFNRAVWPWNIAMIFYLRLVFLSDAKVQYKTLIRRSFMPVVVLWAILPALNLIGIWDSYLSANLYSGRTKNMVVCFSGTEGNLPVELQPYFLKRASSRICPGKTLSISSWSLKELGVPCYPEERVFARIKELMQAKYGLYKLHFYISGDGRILYSRFRLWL